MKNKGKIILVTIALVMLLAIIMGIRPFVVVSGSMEPSIPTGSLCFIDTTINPKDIKEGDVISFLMGKGHVTHRVIKITDEGFKTKGDANKSPDYSVIKKSQVTGINLCHIPMIGYLLIIVQKYWYIAIIIAIAIFGIFESLKKKGQKYGQFEK